MQKIIYLILLAICLVGYSPPHDSDCGYAPILMTREQLSQSIRSDGPRDMFDPGKIYLKDQYIFIVEKFQGIHVIDNSDRVQPKKVGFLHIPGCIDLAIKGTILYADNAVDLVSIHIGNFPNIEVLHRNENVFPDINSPGCDYVPYIYSTENRPAGTIIVGWKPI